VRRGSGAQQQTRFREVGAGCVLLHGQSHLTDALVVVPRAAHSPLLGGVKKRLRGKQSSAAARSPAPTAE